MKLRIQGQVVLSCVIDIDGRCTDIQVIKSLDAQYGLDEEAIKAAGETRFEPGTLAGKPVKVRIMIEFAFNLR